jgi:SAM-dependent methyltransferase
MSRHFQTIFKEKTHESLALLTMLTKWSRSKTTLETWHTFFREWGHYSDKQIYVKLRTLLKQENKAEQKGRTQKMANYIFNLCCCPQRFLDYGCGNGAITKELQQRWNVSATDAFGADIFPHHFDEFHYIQIDENSPDPLASLPSESIDVIVCSMSLHHVKCVEHVLREFRRILTTKGRIVVREHNCQTTRFAQFLDIIHGLYSLVLTEPVEKADFCESFFSAYKSRQEWNRLFAQFDFIEVNYMCLKKHPMHAYYSVFGKQQNLT